MNADRQRLENERKAAIRYFRDNFSREQRYLISFERDFTEYLSSAAWLQSDEARKCQKFFDFQICFEGLKEKMKEFRWSKEFLLAHGIDFVSIKKLYFSVAG